MNTLQFLVLFVIAAKFSFAQSSVPTPDACILTCAEQVCPSEFSNANNTDYSCFCGTGAAAIITCLVANCTTADLTSAEQLSSVVCSGVSSTSSSATQAFVTTETQTHTSASAPETTLTTSTTTQDTLTNSETSTTTTPKRTSSASVSGTSTGNATSTGAIQNPVSSGASTHTGSISSGAIGGIVGGILGALLLICVAAFFFVLGRRTRQAGTTSNETPSSLTESGNEKGEVGGRLAERVTVREPDVSGQLRYPAETDIGGRLGTLE